MHVAVIHDDDVFLAGFAQILRNVADIEPAFFKKAADAFHWLGGVEPAFIVVNNTLEDMTGIEFVRRLRGTPDRANTPIIFTTSEKDRDMRRQAFELNCYAYIEKPINPAEFLVHAMHIVDANRERADMAARLKQASNRDGPPITKAMAESKIIDAMLEVAALHDPTIVAHHALAAKIAIALAREMKLTTEEVQLLNQAVRIYDIGKVAIPQRILESHGQATQVDRVTIERHPEAGAKILAGSDHAVMKAAAQIALTHHERFDGKGYPKKLRGSAIPVFGRIVSVADTLSAMMRARADRPAASLAKAMGVIEKGSGNAYDPGVTAALRGALNEISKIAHEANSESEAS
jgi:response regulator RpfG family c-di-GMP phosphodiesterase